VVMANGSGLLGDGSSTQSALIVKQPGNNSLYYVFTTDDVAGTDGFRYSIVDMALAAGMGSVTVKNILIYSPSAEKITAVKHCNGTDVWVVSRDYDSNNYRAILLTASGLNATPVLSSVGSVMVNTASSLGYLRFSPNGQKMAAAVYAPSNSSAPFYLYDFDSSTGIISNPVLLMAGPTNYGIEFSPNGTKLYGSDYMANKIFQWDLCAGTDFDIISSKYEIVVNQPAGALQLASNGKIYVAINGQMYLDVINTPDLSGAACGYVNAGQSIAPKLSGMGLPNFECGLFKPALPPFTHVSNCMNYFFYEPAGIYSYSNCSSATAINGFIWQFDDPQSGAANTSTLSAPGHTFSTAGVYNVKLIYYHPCSSDTIVVPVTVTSAPTLSVAGSFTVCKGDHIKYTASGAGSYSWATSSNIGANTVSITLTPTVQTTFTLTGTGVTGCKASKAYTITVNACDGLSDNTGFNFKVYPNPVQQQLAIECEESLNVYLYNQSGELLLQSRVEAGLQAFSLSGLESGFYSLKLSNGQFERRLKIIKVD
ncbi:MAG: T9SS type A sorting domain-containing protein, partial [Bacteroidia bacterium]|nr:T9SS type A sorting domain-containing protein [Bacteroidia bacterium]